MRNRERYLRSYGKGERELIKEVLEEARKKRKLKDIDKYIDRAIKN